MKHLNKLWVRIVVATVIGFLFAGAGTHIIYSPCLPGDVPTPPGESLSRCAEFAKAVDHPGDLLNNKQGSLTHFSETFLQTALVSFALLSIFSLARKKYFSPVS